MGNDVAPQDLATLKESKRSAQPGLLGAVATVLETSASQREIFNAIAVGGQSANLAFNESMTLYLEGELDEAAFQRALMALVARHDAFRSLFNRLGTQLLVLTELAPDYRYLRATSVADAEALLQRVRTEAVSEPFDLQRGPLLRVSLVQQDATHHAAVITSHHIVCDGWSIAVALEDLGRYYSSFAQGRGAVMPATQGMVEYLLRLRSPGVLQQAQQDQDYWLQQFAGRIPEPLDLPTDKLRPSLRSFSASRIDRPVQPELVSALKKLAAVNKSTFVAVLFSAFSVLLQRLSGQRDLVVGMPAAGQAIESMDRVVGHCVNTLPLRVSLDPGASFLQNLGEARQRLLASYDHQRLTFGELVAKLKMRRDPSRVPLVPVLFNLDQGIQDLRFHGLAARAYSNPRVSESFELFLNITEHDGGLLLECQYTTDLFAASTIERWLILFEQLLQQLVTDPALPLDEYSLLVQEDRARWSAFNATRVDFPRLGLPEFLTRVAHPRQRIADQHRSLDSATLWARADAVASHLADAGVGPGHFVGICLGRGLDMLAAVLGVLKSGAAYVPLDPQYPVDRLRYMCDDSGLKVLLHDAQMPESLAADRVCIALADVPASASFTPVAIDPESPAYMIYTSGSTGKPKGVRVPHRSVVNFLVSMAAEPGSKPGERLLAVTTLSFDIAVLELLLPLHTGADLMIADDAVARDGFQLMRLLDEADIQVMQATPSTWRMLIAAGWQGRPGFRVFTGGEALTDALAADLLTRVAEVWNLYGPTETTIWSLVSAIQRDQPVTLGHPIANTQVHVVDDNLRPVAQGVAGELLIGGEGVTLGYWQRPELNAERFVQYAQQRCYRTGDLVRMDAQGRLRYLGRMDNQVKLRGFRIELGEIENAINHHPAVEACALMVREASPGDQRLVAYVVATGTLALGTLRNFLAETLPDYMLPQHLMQMQTLPLTPNGKIDRKALPSLTAVPSADTTAEQADLAVSPLEQRLSSLWAEALGLKRVGVEEDFFSLGGHSLMGAQLLARINRELGAELGLAQLFLTPTVRGLAAQLKPAENIVAAIPARNLSEVAATPQQRRLWYLEQLEEDGRAHNLPASWRLKGKLDIDALNASLNALVTRQRILSAVLRMGDGELMLQFQTPCPLQLNPEALSLEALPASLTALAHEPFDLDSGPLFRFALWRLGDDDHVLAFVVHHCVFDGWSFDVLLHELCVGYNARRQGQTDPLAPLNLDYGDYAAWLRERLADASLDTQLDYWQTQLAGELPALELPLDRPRPAQQSHDAAAVNLQLSEADVLGLERLAHQTQTTLFMVMLAAFRLMLYRYSRQPDLVIGAPIAGRNQATFNDLVGFFVNTLLLRLPVDAGLDFRDWLAQVKTVCVQAFAHQELPFERLVQVLNPPRDLSRSPIFQTLFLFQDVRNRRDRLEGLTVEQINVDRAGVQTDLDCWVKREASGLVGAIEYPTALFDADTAQHFAAYYQALLKTLAQGRDLSMTQLLALTGEEQNSVTAWNATSREWPQDLLPSRWQTATAPERVVGVAGDVNLSAGELARRSNQLSHTLKQLGVKPGDLVGLCLNRSPAMLVAALGIWKAGAAYVPLDPGYPEERLRYMLEASAVSVMVTERALAQTVADFPCRRLLLDAEAALLDAAEAKTAAALPTPEHLAYVIFTSGSTGKPKGVQVPHSAVHNFLHSMAERPGFRKGEHLLAVTTLSFDIAVLELYLPLLVGGTVVLASAEDAADGASLARLLATQNIDLMQATPSTWRLLLGSGWEGRPSLRALVGGEALPADLAKALRPKVQSVWNMYGPTETTVWSTCHEITDPDAPLLIGGPIANTRCHVVDTQGLEVPPGVAGELWIGGDGVSVGYLGRPDLTAERFVAEPGHPGAACYRTGDRVRWRRGGQLEYFQRMDQQVKVRGFRIELGEIEAVLAQHPAVAEVAVLAREYSATDKRLVAYIRFRPGEHLTNTELRRFLRGSLPDYMIPQLLVDMQTMPLTPNGKLDRKALPDPLGDSQRAGQLTPPRSDNEKALAAIWAEVLKTDQIGVESYFFDIGGHSLLAMEVMVKVQQRLGARLHPRELVLNTLEQLAGLLPGAIPEQAPARGSSPGFLKRLFGKRHGA